MLKSRLLTGAMLASAFLLGLLVARWHSLPAAQAAPDNPVAQAMPVCTVSGFTADGTGRTEAVVTDVLIVYQNGAVKLLRKGPNF
ncbi:MAG TPA: hypothetical protein PLZ36_05485 [Armatimonadota bacterium]|nr:hypothetical protein [Armatimonadota bacterium]HOS44184.1 hypothetical protein [Armatimonadota bacterium]